MGERVRLGDLLEETFSGEWGSKPGNESTAVLRTANFNSDGSFDYTSPAYRSIDEKKVAAKLLRKGDIVLEKSGGTPSRPVGIAAYFNSDMRAVCSNFNQVLRFDTSKMVPLFAFCQLRWLRSKGAFARYSRKTTGLQNIQIKRFLDIEMVVPPIRDQDLFARMFTCIFRTRQALLGQLRLFDQLVKSQFVEMFGDPTTEHDGWLYEPIGNVCQVITGNTPSRKDEANYGDYVEWCKTDNITEARYLTKAAESLSKTGAQKGRVAPAGSVLMACIAGSIKTIGKVAINDRSVAFNQQINALIPMDELCVDYLLWALRLSKNYLCSDVNMQLKGILNKSALSAKKYVIPPFALQQQFASFVAEVDKSRFVVQRQIEKLQTLYDSLAQEYFG